MQNYESFVVLILQLAQVTKAIIIHIILCLAVNNETYHNTLITNFTQRKEISILIIMLSIYQQRVVEVPVEGAGPWSPAGDRGEGEEEGPYQRHHCTLYKVYNDIIHSYITSRITIVDDLPIADIYAKAWQKL